MDSDERTVLEGILGLLKETSHEVETVQSLRRDLDLSGLHRGLDASIEALHQLLTLHVPVAPRGPYRRFG